jgi:NTP pyrophosphatase (non-canonical NTP hydrolase)
MDITIKNMMKMSNDLYDLHKDSWTPKNPESNMKWLLWLTAEVGEVIDIVKKDGTDKIMKDNKVRDHMLEEITDCYMFLADILNRYEYTPEEFSRKYKEKMHLNMKRDY